MEHPFLIIQKQCEHNGIPQGEMFSYLLEILSQSHVMHGVQGFAKTVTNSANVFSEIMGTSNLIGKTDRIPVSMLAAVDQFVQVQWMLDSANAKNLRDNHNQHQQADMLDRKAKAEQTLHLILRDLMNQGETQGLEYRMNLEEMLRKEQKNPPDQPGYSK